MALDRFGVERYLHRGQCVDACPEAFYHTAERSCERCSDHCRLCTSAGRCLRCNPSYSLSDGLCAKLECGEGNPGGPGPGPTSALTAGGTHTPLFCLPPSSDDPPPVPRRGGGPRLRRLHGLRGGLQEMHPV